MTLTNLDDIIVWPDDSWCYRDELVGFSHKSDDYLTLYANTDEWSYFLADVIDNAD